MKNPLHGDGALWRRLALLGASRGPTALLRLAPPVVGTIFYVLRPAHRRGVRKNLARILGRRSPLEARRDELRTFIAFARSFAEGIAALGPRADDVEVDVEGAERFEAIAREGKGCIFVTAHTSSFEVAAAALGRRSGVTVVMAMRAEPDAKARRISDAVRKNGGLRIVHVGDDPLAVLSLVHDLRAGSVVGVQIDRVPRGLRGLPVTMFGEPREVPLGPFALSRATGAPILPVFTRRTGFLRVKVKAATPIVVPKRATRDEMAQAAQGIVRELEDWVREAPNEWLDWGEAG